MRQVLGSVVNLPLHERNSVGFPSSLKPCKTGSIHLCQSKPGGGAPIKVRVVFSVYRNNFDRYAVVSSNKILCKDCGYINLKTCTVKKVDQCTVQIIPRNGETGLLSFSVASPAECDAWIAAMDSGAKSPFHSLTFTPTVTSLSRAKSPLHRSDSFKNKSLLMPALEEDEELPEHEE